MSIYFVFVLMFTNVANVLAARVVLTLHALDLGAQPFEVGMIAACFALFPMLLSWVSGKLSDRFGARWLLMLGAAGGGLGMLVPYYFPGLTAVYVAAALNGLSLTFFAVSSQNLVGLLSSEQDRARNFSNYTMFGSVASVLGPVFAGFSVEHAGFAASFLYLLAWTGLPVILLAIWGGRLPGGKRSTAKAGSIWITLKEPGVLRVLVVSSLAQCGNNIFQFYMPVYGSAIGLTASRIGVVLAMPAGAGFLSRMLLPRLIEWLTAKKVLACAFALGALNFALLPFFTSVPALALLSFMFGFGMNCSQPITIMLMFSNSAEGRSGEALGLRFTADNFTKLVNPVLFGLLASALGLGAVFWVSALMLAAGSVLAGAGNDSAAKRA